MREITNETNWVQNLGPRQANRFNAAMSLFKHSGKFNADTLEEDATCEPSANNPSL